MREAVNTGVADYSPIHLSQVPDLFRRRRVHLDATLVQVSPPDAHGFCSLGVSVDVVKAAVENADYVVAEINPHMPRNVHARMSSVPLPVARHDRLAQRRGPIIAKLNLAFTLSYTADTLPVPCAPAPTVSMHLSGPRLSVMP